MTIPGLLEQILQAASSSAGKIDAASFGPLDAELLLGCLDDIRMLVVRDLDGALDAIEFIGRLVDLHGSAKVRARLGSVHAHALNYATRFEEAVRTAVEAVAVAESIGDQTELARAQMVLVHAHAMLGRLAEALESALAAERAFTATGQTEFAVQALCNAAIVTRMKGDAAAAIEMFDRALVMREHDPATRAQIESGRAEALLDVGRFEDAEAGFTRSAEAFESIGVTRAAALVRGNLADLYGRQGRLSAAIEQFETARRFFEEDEAYGELGRILTEQADVYAATGLVNDAIANYRRAGELLQRAGSVQEQARALSGMGRLLGSRDPEGATEALDRAALLNRQAGNEAGWALARLHRARLDLTRGAWAEASEAVDSAAAQLDGRQSDMLLCEVTRADIMIARGEHTDAEALLTSAMHTASTLGLPIYHSEILWKRAVARRGAGNTDGAIGDTRAAIDLIERIRGTLQGSRFRAGLVGGSRAVYEQAVGLLLESGAVIEAFETTERARGRTLLDLLGGGSELDAAAEAEDGATRRLLRDLASARAELNAVYTGLDPTAGGPAHTEWLDRLQRSEDRVTALETRLHASRRIRELLGVPEPFGRIAAELNGGQALVSYWSDGESMRAFVVRNGQVSETRLPGNTEEIDEAIQDVLFQIRRGLMRGPINAATDRRASACRAALASLYELIWRPLTADLDGATQVAIVPAGPLHAVPFAALHDGSHALIERIEPLLLPTASVLPLLRGTGTTGDRGVCVLAVPDQIAPEIEAEAWALRDTVPDATVIVGDGATSEAARAHAASAGVLHLACHGAFPPSNPLAAGLKLADRWITVRDVLSWRLPGSVVVLSGCDTGRNSMEAGEELFGFGRGFLAAGARGLVMSLWSAHDATTRGLMSEMYRALDGQRDPSGMRRSLVSAQRSQIESGIHPAFWSNFVYLGV
ncbi:MAG: CHAT domain-containing protein [Phycisphaeraceae bacterium]|nr:MAG: CHAT domain-containing protein [Phycisphaeraceae bacterium]